MSSLPLIDVSRDPADNFLLAMAAAGDASYLVTGDRRGLLSIGRYQQTQIVTARQFIDRLRS